MTIIKPMPELNLLSAGSRRSAWDNVTGEAIIYGVAYSLWVRSESLNAIVKRCNEYPSLVRDHDKMRRELDALVIALEAESLTRVASGIRVTLDSLEWP